MQELNPQEEAFWRTIISLKIFEEEGGVGDENDEKMEEDEDGDDDEEKDELEGFDDDDLASMAARRWKK